MPDFRSTTPNRGLTRLQMQQDANSRLNQEAFSLQPDTDAITKAIMDKKLYSSNMTPILNEANGFVSDYMEKFTKDPFYAFTREGRKTAATLKQIVNHPDIKKWEEDTAATEAEYKRASDNRLNKNFVVRGNDVLAIKDGKKQYISLNDVKRLDPEKGDGLLDVDTDIKHIRSVSGVQAGIPSYDMSKLDDVDKKIRDAFSSLGSFDNSGVKEGNDYNLKVRDKTNLPHIQSAIRKVLTSGLTQSDRNTLKSEYLKEVGPGASATDFEGWLRNLVTDIGTGKLETVTEREPIKKIGGAGGAGGSSKQYPLTEAQGVLKGDFGKRNVHNVMSGITPQGQTSLGLSLEGNKFPAKMLDMSKGQAKDDFGNPTPNRTMSSLNVLANSTDLTAAQVFNHSSKQWENVPSISQLGVVSDKPGSEPTLVYPFTYTVNGKPVLIPPRAADTITNAINNGKKIPSDLQQYLTKEPLQQAIQNVVNSPSTDQEKQNSISILKDLASRSGDGTVTHLATHPWVNSTVVVASPKGLFGIGSGRTSLPPGSKELGNKLKEFGYNPAEDESAAKYHSTYGGMGNAADTGMLTSDDMFETNVMTPLTSVQALHQAFGGNVMGYPEDVTTDTMGLIENYQNIVSPELLNNNSIQNQVNKSKFVKRSEY